MGNPIISGVTAPIRAVQRYLSLPPEAKAMQRRDSAGLRGPDPGVERAVLEAVGWICRAQDHSSSRDGGVARHYSLLTGWGPSYPETTGYIVPTILDCGALWSDDGLRQRASRMLDWLVSIQHPDGSFHGGVAGALPAAPVTFNTGQILLGLARGVREFGDRYVDPMRRAADWLVETQDPDGAWRRHHSPYALREEHTYDTHVAWGLLEAARLEPEKPYARAALANIRWAMGLQEANGWFGNCCLSDPSRPLTHTIGYALRGILEGHRFTGDFALLRAAQRAADGLLNALRSDGGLPGRLDRRWKGAVRWVCLTGSVQVAFSWLMMYQVTGNERYLKAAQEANCFVRRTVEMDGPPERRGAVGGSFPTNGAYGSYAYLNWACKFFVDSNLLERSLRGPAAHV